MLQTSGRTLHHNTTYSSPTKRMATQNATHNLISKSIETQEEELMLKIQQMMLQQNAHHHPPEEDVRGLSFVEQQNFEAVIAFFIILNALQMGCALAVATSVWVDVWLVCEHIFTLVFFVEMVLKIYFLRWRYFKNFWRFLDFGLVWIAVVDNWVLSLIPGVGNESLNMLRLFRLLRIIRLLKVMKHNPHVIVLIQGIGGSIRSMLPISLLLCLIIYAMSLVCVEVLLRDNEREKFENQEPPFNVDKYFGSLPRAWLTLFNMVILAEWPEVVRPLFSALPLLVPPFIVFVTLCSFAIMNVVIGIICQQTDEATARCQAQAVLDDRATQMRVVQKLVHLIARADTNGDGTIDICEFENESVKGLLRQIDLPPGMTPEETHIMLDYGGDGIVTIEECLTCMFRLINATEFQKECLNTISLNHIKRMATDLQSGQNAISEGIGEVVKEVRGLRSDLGRISGDGSLRPSQSQAAAHAAAQPLSPAPSARAAAAPVIEPASGPVQNSTKQPDVHGIAELRWMTEALDGSQQALRALDEKQEEALRLIRALLSLGTLPGTRPLTPREQSQVSAPTWGKTTAASTRARPLWPSGHDPSSPGDCVSALSTPGLELPRATSHERGRSVPPTRPQHLWPTGLDPWSSTSRRNDNGARSDGSRELYTAGPRLGPT